MVGELDQAVLLTTALDAARDLLPAAGSSFWTDADDDLAECRMAVGAGADALSGTTIPLALLLGDGRMAMGGAITAPVVAGERTVGYLRVTSADAAAGGFAAEDRTVLALIADVTGAALQLAARLKAGDRSDDIRLVQALSREIGSSLDLDRVLQTAVNLAARALDFDFGALALYENGRCDIRAVAGASTVDGSTAEMQVLSFRAAWAAGTGEALYVSDRDDPGSDAERIFLQFFGEELAAADMRSGLYLPLRDEEGIVGILLFEAKQPEFASERARDVAAILANQATVAIRNAKLYSQVPMAEAFGAISARRAAFFAVPRRKRLWATASAVILLAVLTLVRWPLRVMAESPVLQPTGLAVVRPLESGLVERVLVREGDTVAAGMVVARLSDAEARLARTAAEAEVRAAGSSATLAASRGDAAEQRLQAIRQDAARATLALRVDALGRLEVRAPVSGFVLTSRPERLEATRVAAGAPLLRLGRTDTLELEFGVEQRDVQRVRVGDEVRVRLDGSPQETFAGTVTMVGAMPLGAPATNDSARVLYPVRAAVPNTSGTLRAGMAAHARVLTAPASIASRMLRTPARAVRLLWWRAWSWL
jgi:RND family efflux transporter MFP subunit